MVFSIKGYHTCKDKGGIQFIKDQAPFLSRPEKQWLGQGYYFWTDSDYWARRWMSEPKVITEFEISFTKDKVLDLVGNVKDQELFQDICELFNEGFPYYEAYKKQYGDQVSVGAIISLLRDQKAFPYGAVKARDHRSTSQIAFSVATRFKLSLVEPHQLCVFQEYRAHAVKFERFVHPAHYC